MTVVVNNNRFITSVSILIVLIHPMIKLDVDSIWDCFPQEVKQKLAIH